MLVIRDVQMRALSLAMLESWIAGHVRRHFPHHAEALGDHALRETIETATRRAGAHGFIREQDICQYVDLTIMFGEQFEKRPEAPWAAAILSDRSTAPEDRMRRLYVAALQHLRRIAAIGASGRESPR